MNFVFLLFSYVRKFLTFCSDRYLNPPFIRLMAITIISICILNLCIIFWTSAGGVNIFGSWMGGDYPCFYIAGKMLNDYPPQKLYDFNLHNRLLHSLFPKISSSDQIPYINPPFFALIFKPLSLLPYSLSYLIWIFISIILFLCAIKLTWKTLDSMPSELFIISLLLAFSFEPFLMENILGGNCSALGLFALSLFLYFQNLDKEVASGISLGILLYKPTFLIVLLPMLCVARRTKVMLGFAVSAMMAVLLSVMMVGTETCMRYVQFLFGFSSIKLDVDQFTRLWKYVDVFSFSRLLFRHISSIALILIAVAASIPVIYSIRLWWNMNTLNKTSREILIASAITLTHVINLHFGIYDCVFLILPILLTVNAFFRNFPGSTANVISPIFKALLLSIYILPWFTQHVARITDFQMITIIIAGMGYYQIYLAGIYSKTQDDGSGGKVANAKRKRLISGEFEF